MAHLHKKMKKGRPYYYIREMARVEGKPKVVRQIYLGSVERILKMVTQGSTGCVKIKAEQFGALWLADQIDRKIDFAGLVDSIVPQGEKQTGPSVGEYFLYAVFNRMIDARSKRALKEWYNDTAIRQIRPVNVDALTSQRFWERWEQVSKAHIEQIANRFLKKLNELEPSESDCFLFDTTNYYTFMAGQTESELAKTGKNKEGRNWLRQIGVALLVSRDKQLPMFYREYEGNRHDAALCERLLGEIFDVLRDSGAGATPLTLVFDKGMNSKDNIAFIDAKEQLHFITSYSTYFAEHLIHQDMAHFKAVDTAKNIELKKLGRHDDLLLARRTTEVFWGKERTVIVTYNPLTASKQRYAFEKKLSAVQAALYEMRSKLRAQAPQWKQPGQVKKRYEDLCKKLHFPDDLYDLDFEKLPKGWAMGFRKNPYRIRRHIDRFGKNILVTDLMEWSTLDIVQAALDRYVIEKMFRQSKDDDLVSVLPVRHWTDSKIRCHILTCVVALAYLRLIEIHLKRSGMPLTATCAMDYMHKLHSCLCWHAKNRKPMRIIENPSKIQADILKAFGYQVIDGGVLQKKSS